jgi:hypothetical protein
MRPIVIAVDINIKMTNEIIDLGLLRAKFFIFSHNLLRPVLDGYTGSPCSIARATAGKTERNS